MSILRRLSFYKIKGKNNKIIKIKNAKLYPQILLPKGITTIICGDDNIIKFEYPIKLSKVKISIFGKNNEINIGKNTFIDNSNVQINGDNNLFNLDSNGNIVDSSLCVIGNENSIKFCPNVKTKKSEFYTKGNENHITFNLNTKFITSKQITKGCKNIIYSENNIEYNNCCIENGGNNNSYKIEQTKFPINKAYFYTGAGGAIYIGKNACMKEEYLHIVVNNGYKNSPKLTIGENVLIARDVIIRTSDGHTLIDAKTNAPTNKPEDITIGNNVWITSRCTILKGSTMPDNCVIGACSLVNKKFKEKNTILAGIPAKIIRHNIKWSPMPYKEYVLAQENNNKEKVINT